MGFDYTQHVFRSRKFQSVVNDAIDFLLGTPVYELPPSSLFIGSGVYALYYVGRHKLYAKIALLNQSGLMQPIYVGKAVPPGWRTARVTSSATPDLYRRLGEHARSIQQTADLRAHAFRCRFAILGNVEADLVAPLEAELIRRYRPLWNTVVDGFGNHDPGSGRYNQARSEWDILHPGRLWAERLMGASSDRKAIIAKVKRFLR